MSDFLSIQRCAVPSDLLLKTHLHLRKVGKSGHEGFALWAGNRVNHAFTVSNLVIPAQEGLRTSSGVCVRVEGDELHRINVWLFENELRLIAQIHSHPTDAYHSDTDDAFPIVTTEGGLSLVVPNFARGAPDLLTYAVFRLLDGRWIELSDKSVSELLQEI